MTIAELKGKLVAFGEGDDKHGYSQTDNPEPAERKLRHKFWEGATLAEVKPGCYVATLAKSDALPNGGTRVLFVK